MNKLRFLTVLVALTLLAGAVALVSAETGLSEEVFVSGNFAGRGRSLEDAPNDTKSITTKRMYYYDPDNPNIPEFELSACVEIDLDAPEPEHLPGLGDGDVFNYGVEKVTVRVHSDNWIKDGFYLFYIWKEPNREVVDYMTRVFVPDPWAIVALWDYWEWTTLWQELPTRKMNPGVWTADVFFHWYGQSREEAEPVGTVSFTLEDVNYPSGVDAIAEGSENYQWEPPVFDVMTLCRDIDLDAIQFDMMPPIGPILDRNIIRGDQTVWAYVRFLNQPERDDRKLDESFHVVFDFRYEDELARINFPYMDGYVFDVPHARSSFSGWEYWSDYYVAAIDFCPLKLGMYSGKWAIDISVYPHKGHIGMVVPIGTVHFTVQGGEVPEAPEQIVLPDKMDVLAYPNPFDTEVTFTFSSGGLWLTGSFTFSVAVYDLSGRMVWSGEVEGADEIVWDGRDEAGDVLANGPYIYVAYVRDGTNVSHGKGKVFILR